MVKIVICLIVVFGFIYGRKYFRFFEPFGSSENYFQLGMYILSMKWWNVKFNWYVIYDKWHIDISLTFPINRHMFREYIVVISSTGFHTCTVDIDKR